MPSARVCMLVRNDCRTDYRVLKEAGSLARAGYRVTIVAINPYGPLEREEQDGFEVIRVPVEYGKTKWERGMNLFPRAIYRMARVASQMRADVYHAHDSDGILPAWLAVRRVPGARLIYDAHEVGFISLRESVQYYRLWAGLANWLWSRWNDWIVPRHVDVILSVNETLADLQAQHYGVMRPAVVMNCPPRSSLQNNIFDLCQTLKLDQKVPVVICQGMFSLARGDGVGLENLVHSARLLHRGVVVLIGNTGDKAEFEPLRNLARQPEFLNRVFILPTVPPEQLQAYTAEANIGVIPLQLSGLARYASPNKLFEYLAAGLPVIIGDMPPTQKICDDYACGLLCDPRSPRSIADAINRLIDDPALYATMRAGALRAAQIYNWENQERVLLDVYARLLDEHQ